MKNVHRYPNVQKESCKSDNTSCLGKYIEKAEDIRHVRGNKAIYQNEKKR